MLNVFAIDPKIGQDPNFLACMLHCHPSNGRLIADLPPGSWSAETAECINQLDNRFAKKRKRLIERLKKMRTQLVDRPGTSWNYLEPSWVANTENEHQRERFSLIISPDYDELDDGKLTYPPSELFYPEVRAWNTPRSVQINKGPGEFVKTILPMLILAKRINFVDRFFNIDDNSLHTRNYQQIIEKLAKYHNSSSSFPEELIIHCCPKEAPERNYFEDGLEKHYAHLIPEGKSIKVFLWETKEVPRKGNHPFHNRYVLSNHCGVMAGYGTDSITDSIQKEVSSPAPDTLVFVDETTYKDVWKIRKGEWPPGAKIKEKFKIPRPDADRAA